MPQTEQSAKSVPKRKIYMDLTSFYNTDFMSGIQRVVREIAVRLLRMSVLDVVLFTWKNDETALTILDNGDFLKCYDDGSLRKEQIKKESGLTVYDMQAGDILFDVDSVWDIRCHRREEILPQLDRRGVRIVTYIHDVIPVLHPEFWGSLLPLPDFEAYVRVNLLHADTLITSVNVTVERLTMLSKRYGAPEPCCAVSWLGSDFKANSDSGTVSKKARQVVSKGKYILVVGTIEPRKNHRVVLDAWDERLSKLGLNLVFAGRRGWCVDELLQRIDTHSKKDKGFYFLEGESDATIDYLYRNAYAVVFPTLDEGFGLPLVEALLHGAACAVSDIPVMREVGGDSCDYFDPESSTALADVIEGYIKTPGLYADCKRRAGEYKPMLWDEVAERIKNVLVSMEKRELPNVNVKQIMNDVKEETVQEELQRQQKEIQKQEQQRLRELQRQQEEIQRQEMQRLREEQIRKEELLHNLAEVNTKWKVEMYPEVSGGALKRLVKKAIRKLVRPSFYGTMKKQESFNMNVAASLSEMENWMRELADRIAEK